MNRTQNIKRQAPEKFRQKARNTVLGVVLVAFGALLVVGGFWLASSAIANGDGFDKWMLAPVGGGILVVVIGATVWSGELVTAALKDISEILLPFRRKG